MSANFPTVDFLRTTLKFRKRSKILSSLVYVLHKTSRNVQKSVMHVQSCCFAQQTYCFFDVLIAVAVVVAKAPYYCT